MLLAALCSGALSACATYTPSPSYIFVPSVADCALVSECLFVDVKGRVQSATLSRGAIYFSAAAGADGSARIAACTFRACSGTCGARSGSTA
jgi:hypothetical protein